MDQLVWDLVLYVNGASRHSMEAIAAVTNLCMTELAGRSTLRIVDVNDQPDSMREHQVIALPMLIKLAPPPRRRLVGNLADTERLREGLDLGPARPPVVGTTVCPR